MDKIVKRFTIYIDKTLGGDLSIEHILFLFSGLAGLFLSVFGAIGNFIMGLPVVAVLIPFANFIIDVSCVIYSIVTKRWRGLAVVLFGFAIFVIFPFLWFTTGGTMSSSLPLVIGVGVVLSIVFPGKLQIFFFFSTLLMYSTFILVELHYPNNFIPYPNRGEWYMDVLFGFALSYLASGGVACFTLLHYNDAKHKIEILVKQLEKTAITDPLTGIFNCRHLTICIEAEMQKAFDSGSALTLAILDIDYFKAINDTYGHMYGDEVLEKLASTISNCLSENEIFGRYGGRRVSYSFFKQRFIVST